VEKLDVEDSLLKKSKNDGILFFVKYPEIGQVKSRLSAQMDKTFVVTVYKCFVEDILNMLQELEYATIICYYPQEKVEHVTRWIGGEYHYLPQHGENLGERMNNCFIQGFFQGFEKLVVIGSDCPDLPDTLIKGAFQRLDTCDSVIGPCQDGGYYLLGFTKQRFSPTVFQGIPWSTSAVFAKTMDALEKSTLQVSVLPEWQDVDTVDDIQDLYMRNRGSAFKTSKTMAVLNNYFQTRHDR
jgi:rSAM/selenodomain-associated transferase 1